MSNSPKKKLKGKKFDWKKASYFYDVYSSHCGYHFIVWRMKFRNTKQFEVVCHRSTVFSSEETALAACRLWMKEELRPARSVRRPCALLLKWLDKSSKVSNLPELTSVG